MSKEMCQDNTHEWYVQERFGSSGHEIRSRPLTAEETACIEAKQSPENCVPHGVIFCRQCQHAPNGLPARDVMPFDVQHLTDNLTYDAHAFEQRLHELSPETKKQFEAIKHSSAPSK